MTTGGKILLGVGAVGVVGFIYEGNLFREQVKYTLQDISIDLDKTKDANFQFVFVKIVIRIFNPVHFPVPWVRFHGKVEMNGVQVGSAISKGFTLPGNSSSTLTIPLALSTGNVIAQIISLFDGSNEHSITVDGSINSIFGRVPVEGKMNINL